MNFWLLTCFGQVSKNITLLDNWTNDELIQYTNGPQYNEVWGFVEKGQEYAVAGSTEGTHIFEITNDDKLIEVDFIRGEFSNVNVVHRDYHDYQGYLYAVCDEGESSLQIMDLTYLPDSVSLVYDSQAIFGNVHNIFIDTSNALLYACIFTPIPGTPGQSYSSLKVYSLANPLNPIEVFGGISEIPEVHDVYVRDNLAFLNCGFDGLRIYDFTDPSNPSWLGVLSFYQDQGYNHSGWLTPDGSKYFFIDETNGKRIKYCEIGDLGNISVKSLFGTNFQNNSVPHNIMLTNDLAFVSYYNEGLRIYDIRKLPIEEIAHYDTYQQESNYKLNGAWGIYSELPSERLLVSDRQNGLFLFGFDRESALRSSGVSGFSVFPNPTSGSGSLFVTHSEIQEFDLRLFNLAGKLITERKVTNQSYASLPLNVSAGVYALEMRYIDYLGDEIVEVQKVVVRN